jgi:hypothetical protein
LGFNRTAADSSSALHASDAASASPLRMSLRAISANRSASATSPMSGPPDAWPSATAPLNANTTIATIQFMCLPIQLSFLPIHRPIRHDPHEWLNLDTLL